MTDWNSPEELQLDAAVFTKLLHVLLGIYIWEWFTSVDFDLQYLLGRRRFQWPLVFYFLGRYSMMIALIGVVIGLNVTSEINCQGLFIFSQTFGNLAIAMSATNLSLRTMAVWGRSLYIVVPLSVALVGYSGVLLRGVIGVRDVWVTGEGCTIVNSQITILRTIYIYGMTLDFIVMCLTVFKLMTSGASRTPLVTMLVHDGLVYFAISFTANTIAVIFMMLNLNAVMGVVADVPAVVICTIAACRVVRRLNNRGYAEYRREVFAPTSNSVRLTTGPFSGPGTIPTFAHPKDQEIQFKYSEAQSPSTIKTEYDASGRVIRPGMDDSDPEAQAISAEFTPDLKTPTSTFSAV